MISQLTSVVAAISLWHAMPSAAAIIHPSAPAADPSIGACKLAGNTILGFDLEDSVVPAASGVVRGWMMFVDFPDVKAADAGYSAQGVYDNTVAKADAWYRTASYSRMSLNVTADVDQIYRMTKPSTAYNWANQGNNYNQMVFVEDALEAYMEAHGIAEADLKFKLPDMDVLYVVPPPSTPNFVISYGTRYSAQTRSHNGTDGNVVEGTVVAQGSVVFGTGFYREETQSDGSGVNPWKIFVHETGHTLGLPDYYPIDYSKTEGEYVGGFSIMGAIGEQAPDMFAFDKWRLGWLDDGAVQCVTEKGASTHVLQPLEADAASGVRAVMIPTTSTTALVAEARTRKGVDAAFCGVGVLLYTIDTKIRSGSGPVRVVNTLDSDLRWCGGYSLNTAPLSFVQYRSPSKTIKELGITVTLMEHDESADTWTIKVDYI
ncbi:hypothetical protein PG995_006299 [Apiospora arundinis]